MTFSEPRSFDSIKYRVNIWLYSLYYLYTLSKHKMGPSASHPGSFSHADERALTGGNPQRGVTVGIHIAVDICVMPFSYLKCFPPVTDVAPKHLGEAVAPEEAAQHHAGLPLAPVELLRHADGTDGHRHTGAVEEACPEQQHRRPYPRHRPAKRGTQGG